MAETYVLDFGPTNTGGAPAWSVFANMTTLADVAPHPTITEVGGGVYSFPYDWATAPAGCTGINFTVSLNGVDLEGVIFAVPFTVPESTSTSGFTTAGDVINRAAVQCGLAAVADPFTATDSAFVLLVELLKVVGDELQAEATWPQLTREVSITTAAGTLSYALPADFRALVPDTGWNRSSMERINGPLSPQEYQYAKATAGAQVLTIPFRQFGNTIRMPVAPPEGATVVIEYLSRYWVQSTGLTAPDKAAPTATTDVLLFEPLLLVRGLKYQFLTSKGFDNAAAGLEYRSSLDDAKGNMKGARTLSLGGCSRSPFLTEENIPITGYGL